MGFRSREDAMAWGSKLILELHQASHAARKTLQPDEFIFR